VHIVFIIAIAIAISIGIGISFSLACACGQQQQRPLGGNSSWRSGTRCVGARAGRCWLRGCCGCSLVASAQMQHFGLLPPAVTLHSPSSFKKKMKLRFLLELGVVVMLETVKGCSCECDRGGKKVYLHQPHCTLFILVSLSFFCLHLCLPAVVSTLSTVVFLLTSGMM
jgi:hypothetical protein